MTPKKTTKFHFKIQFARKSPKRKLFFYDENANDIAEVDEEGPFQEDASARATYSAAAAGTTTAPSAYLEVNNSSITIINDDSGCFSSDTSLKFFEKADIESKRPQRLGGGRAKSGGVTQRTGIDGSFWDINDDSNQEAFIAIFVKKSLELDVVPSKEPTPPPPSSWQCVRVEKYEELPQELSTVSVQVGEHFCLRTLDSLRENGGGVASGKKGRKVNAVHQRKNEWKKFKLRQ